MPDIQPEAKKKDIGGVDLQYLDYPGNGPALVMLHATGFQPWLWHPIARELCGTFRVITPYFCEHRKFDPREGGLNWGLIAEDLHILCERLGLQDFYVVGHSMGATVGAIAGALFAPFASKMILIEPIFLPEQFYEIQIAVEEHPLAGKSIKRRNFWNDKEEAIAYLRTKALFKNWDKEMLALYITHGLSSTSSGGLELVCHPEREAALFMGGMAADPWPLLPKVDIPCLLIEGGESDNRSVVDLKKAASIMPKAQLKVINGAGHLVPMEKPLEILSTIRDYLGE